MSRAPRAVHALLFAVYPALMLYSLNAAEVPLRATVVPLALSLAGALAAWALLGVLLRDRGKAALATSLLLVLFFTYGYVFDGLAQHEPIRHRTLMAVWALLAAGGLAAIARARRPLRRLHRLLDWASGALVATALLTLAIFFVRRAAEPPALADAGPSARAIPADSAAALPDVYYIIADAFASDSTLREVYGVDDAVFLRGLEARGFHVSAGSHSNYPTTLSSMSSALNMDYLDRLVKLRSDNATNIRAFHRLIRDNRVGRELARFGYEQVLINPPWEMFVGDFAYTLWHTTVLCYWQGNGHYRRQTLRSFDRLAEVPRQPGPTFTYVHFICPHPPYVFGANGEPVTGIAVGAPGREREQMNRLYVDQLRYMSLRLTAAVDTILAHSSVRPIIVLQSDHGPAIEGTLDHPSAATQRHRFRILSTFLAPDSVTAHLYPGISPVNAFRVILRHGYGLPYEPIPDVSHWYAPTQPTVLVRANPGM